MLWFCSEHVCKVPIVFPTRGRPSMWRAALAILIAIMTTSVSTEALAWGGRGHRIVATIAMLLISEKAAQMNTILGQLEKDNNFVDAASYPDEFIRSETHTFDTWHFADLPDGGQTFVCGECLFKALSENLAIIKSGKKDKSGAVAIAWVIHLVGDLSGEDRMQDVPGHRGQGGIAFGVGRLPSRRACERQGPQGRGQADIRQHHDLQGPQRDQA